MSDPDMDEQYEPETVPLGRCVNCQSLEPPEILEAFQGFCTSACEQEYILDQQYLEGE